jgi:hypothetical protein
LRRGKPVQTNGPKKERLKLIAKIATIFISIAIIALVTVSMLVPNITNRPPSSTLLNKTVTLTDENYEVGYSLTLGKGEIIDVKASGNGQPIDFRITDNESSTLIEERGDTFYDVRWKALADGTYTFYVSATAGGVRATVMVVKVY